MTSGRQLATRRRVLKGMLQGTGLTVGLPFLECFLNSNGTALAATGQALPPVFGTWSWELGFNPGRWEPTTIGRMTELGPEAKPLERFREKINLYSGMKVYFDGRPTMPHFSGNMAMLTGTAPRSNPVVMPTIDTLVADQIGSRTRFKSIEMVCTGDPKDSRSFRAGGVLQAGEVTPASLYARLFGPEFRDPKADFRPDPQVMARQSVLSMVGEQRRNIERAVGASDRARLDEYFTSLRQLEQQIAMQLEKPAPIEACSIPARPGEAPVGAEIDVAIANHKIFTQLAAHAFACNQTQVSSLTFSVGSLRRAGTQMTHHMYTHEEPMDAKLGYQPNVAYFIDCEMQAFADYLTALSSIREGDRTLLDRCLIFAVTDTGYAKAHSYENIPMITAGSAGGRMKTGIHVAGRGDPISRVGLTIQQALQLPLSSWGTDSMATTKTITEVLP